MQLVFKKPYKSIKALLNIELNDFTVLTGVNGSGKSHLLEAIKNGSIRVEGITLNNNANNNYLNQIRLFDWSNLVPNDTEAINSYDFNQGRDNDWKTFDYQTSMYKNQLKQWLRKNGIHDTSNTQIYELASMEKSELAQELNNTQKADEIYIKIQELNNACKDDFVGKNSLNKLYIEKLENICKAPFICIDEDNFYKNYLINYTSHYNYVDIFQHSFTRLFNAYAKIRVNNEFREFRNSKGQPVSFLSEQEFREQNGEPPWDFVNDILAKANLDFRINKPDGYDDKPYQATLINQISGDSVNFSDLSSGEKILISFALCLYYTEDKKQVVNYPKVLLFDEIDAPLHPSMTQSILRTIQEILVDKHKIKVILTTHSPSTVALSPESSIYVMTKDRNNRLEKITKDKALSVLTEGIPTLSIDYDNRRQIFVESKNDIQYYEIILDKIKQYLIPEISLNFISSGTNGENCDQVKSIVKALVNCGNQKVYGIIDWDKNNISQNNIKVLGENKRYSIENYIFDPILVITFLLREKLVTREQLELKETFIYTDILKLDSAELQSLADWIVNEVKTQLQLSIEDPETLECQYISDRKINIPVWYLQMQGHELETTLKKMFPQLQGIARKKGVSEEAKLKLEILSKVVDDLPTLLSKDFIDLFVDIQQN